MLEKEIATRLEAIDKKLDALNRRLEAAMTQPRSPMALQAKRLLERSRERSRAKTE